MTATREQQSNRDNQKKRAGTCSTVRKATINGNKNTEYRELVNNSVPVLQMKPSELSTS